MADGTGKRPHSEEDSQLPFPTKLLRKEEWYYPNSASYGPKKYKPILYTICLQNKLSFSTLLYIDTTFVNTVSTNP